MRYGQFSFRYRLTSTLLSNCLDRLESSLLSTCSRLLIIGINIHRHPRTDVDVGNRRFQHNSSISPRLAAHLPWPSDYRNTSTSISTLTTLSRLSNADVKIGGTTSSNIGQFPATNRVAQSISNHESDIETSPDGFGYKNIFLFYLSTCRLNNVIKSFQEVLSIRELSLFSVLGFFGYGLLHCLGGGPRTDSPLQGRRRG